MPALRRFGELWSKDIRSVAPQHVEDGQRIEIARMQRLLAELD